MMIDFKKRLEEAKGLAEIFEVVKAVVHKTIKKSRAGLMLGMADLGNHPQGFMGGFFAVGSNVIVMNRIPLQRIKETKPELYRPYVFHILLHEYIHSLGYLDEQKVRAWTYQITRDTLGEDHLATHIAAETGSFMKHLVYPDTSWKPNDVELELVEGFDGSSVSYIA